MTLQPHQHPDALSDMVHAYVERIRELEAELAGLRNEVASPLYLRSLEQRAELRARAETAESRALDSESRLKDLTETHLSNLARVAELEIRLASANAAIEVMLREKEE